MDDLIKLRKKCNYTCTYMANKLNISKPYYWQIEHKKRRLTYAMAVRIAAIFDKRPDEIFFEDFKKAD